MLVGGGLAEEGLVGGDVRACELVLAHVLATVEDLRLFNLQFACLRVDLDSSLGNDREVQRRFWSTEGVLRLGSYFFIFRFRLELGRSAPLEFLGDVGIGLSERFVRITIVVAAGVGDAVAVLIALAILHFCQVFFQDGFATFLARGVVSRKVRCVRGFAAPIETVFSLVESC